MNNFKRKTDPRVDNAQQAFQKATFAILKFYNTLFSTKTNVSKETLRHSIDAISLIGHAVGDYLAYAGIKSNLS